MKHTNVRYSTTLNAAQLDYLSDECQDINRMMCFKTFLRMAAVEPVRVSRKNFSADLQAGQFIASKVQLAMLWKCNRKTATRIIKEFNQMGILRSEPSNRTTIHTLLCLSVWFTEHGIVKNRFFVSNPTVKPIEKPTRGVACVTPKALSETAEADKAVPADSDVTSVLINMVKEESSHPLIPHANGVNEPKTIVSSFSLSSDDGTHHRMCGACLPTVMETTDRLTGAALSDDLREDTTRGKGNNDETEEQ